ncbi:hypothetical protein DL769_008521 [Monosporascus sp. CRB-8-3]|nr:hypothetical protein DL769_008521 [Monosporascus sp. CRB-8-3]
MSRGSSTSAKPPRSRRHHHHSSSRDASGSKENKSKGKGQTTSNTPPPPPPPRPGAECTACTTPSATTSPLPPTRQLACGHFYCRDCLRRLVAAQLDAGNPAPECCHDEPVSRRDVRWADRGGPLLARLKALRDDGGAARQLTWRQAQQNKAAPVNINTASAAVLRERNAQDGTDNLNAIYREAAAGTVTICFFCGAAIERAARPGCDDVV